MCSHDENQARLWKPRALESISLFKARFKDFVYSRHVHKEFALGIIEYGVEQFYYRGTTYSAPAGSLLTLNPDELHDGEAGVEYGYHYRMMYTPPDIIKEMLSEGLRVKPALRYFKEPVTMDADIARRFLYAHQLLDYDTAPLLEIQGCLVDVLTDLFLRHAYPTQPPRHLTSYAAIRKAREFIDASFTENPTLDTIAREVGLSRFHFLRLFKTSTGISPHAYLIQRRLDYAKTLIQQGCSLAQAAHEAGFADQSHLTRRFKAAYGITPGQYQHALV